MLHCDQTGGRHARLQLGVDGGRAGGLRPDGPCCGAQPSMIAVASISGCCAQAVYKLPLLCATPCTAATHAHVSTLLLLTHLGGPMLAHTAGVSRACDGRKPRWPHVLASFSMALCCMCPTSAARPMFPALLCCAGIREAQPSGELDSLYTDWELVGHTLFRLPAWYALYNFAAHICGSLGIWIWAALALNHFVLSPPDDPLPKAVQQQQVRRHAWAGCCVACRAPRRSAVTRAHAI